MKTLFSFIAIFILLSACKKSGFDIDNPDVDVFVQQLKAGTYSQYETNEKGERLWLKMPKFGEQHIARLIELSKDTTHINQFPTNPMSSRTPRPQGRNYFILGEGLLWIVAGINGRGSLDPYLIDDSKEVPEKYNGLTTTEILLVSEKYSQWWNSYKNADWKAQDPLAGTAYIWM